MEIWTNISTGSGHISVWNSRNRYSCEVVARDTVGVFDGSRSTKRYLHSLVDHFTTYAHILTSKIQKANDH